MMRAKINPTPKIKPAPPKAPRKAPRFGYNQAAHKMDLGRFA